MTYRNLENTIKEAVMSDIEKSAIAKAKTLKQQGKTKDLNDFMMAMDKNLRSKIKNMLGESINLEQAILEGGHTLVEQTSQVTVGDYTTKHFDICPSAVKLYSNISGKTPMTHLVVETMMLHDILFRLEKQVIAQGSADEDDVEKAEEFAELIMDNAEQMGLEDEHSYIEDVHLAKFKQLAGEENEEEEEDEEEEEEMNEKTLTPAELKKREEIAKAIKRENPNMPMAKKMAIATATAKKVAEARIVTGGYRDATGKYIPGKTADDIAREKASKKREAMQKTASVIRKEEVELDEAVEVSHDRYMRSHGKKASGGEGNWMFTHKRMGDANVNDPKEVHSARGKFSDAKRSAQQWAKKHGHSTVYVMEEVEQIDELKKSTLGSYVNKAAVSKDKASGRTLTDTRAGKYRDAKTFAKRSKGLHTAFDKILGKARINAKEEVERIDEISTDLAHDVYKKRMDQAKAHVRQDNYSAARKAEKKAGETSLRMVKKILRKEEINPSVKTFISSLFYPNNKNDK